MKRALLVIDVQNEYFTGKLPVVGREASLENISLAIQASQHSKIPVIVIQHAAKEPQSPIFAKGSSGWELHPSIKAQRADCLIEKHFPGSFTGTELEVYLKEHQIDTVTISGYMTQVCCDTTARQAFHLGYKGGIPFRCHRNAGLFQRGRLRHRRGVASRRPRHPSRFLFQGVNHSRMDFPVIDLEYPKSSFGLSFGRNGVILLTHEMVVCRRPCSFVDRFFILFAQERGTPSDQYRANSSAFIRAQRHHRNSHQ